MGAQGHVRVGLQDASRGRRQARRMPRISSLTFSPSQPPPC
eukprot:CAMPEP_0206038282 /NCGR_PEP_ID=MMETSP1466-20131121/4005_1 /ASSEMBLY_ACC=CAM_ASM_001126 /TAXON_ID=44452 /ORGANISM="Pavlova gyrans, Strain CCMP608" /LENGTH=40 /DNA_ID= /DNA_START= /DNA_END= /DNA_ORIENTATION=